MTRVASELHPLQAKAHDPLTRPQSVILVHGLAQTSMSTWLLGRRLKRSGFAVALWGYRSWWGSLARHADRLREEIRQRLAQPDGGMLHLVGHSMGAILIRKALGELPRAGQAGQLGRVVFLGPPNHGSKSARRWARFIGLGRFFPVLRELSDESHSLVRHLPPLTQAEIGIIAAGRDRVVAEPSTHLAEEKDHRVIACSHTRLLFHREVARQVCCFLRDGRFQD
jgi:pimeloyl-ACP methyl ester carboxylesterase